MPRVRRSWVLVAALALLLTGCGSDASDTAATTTTTITEPPAARSVDEAQLQAFADGLVAAASDLLG